jgi:hypothetical protein
METERKPGFDRITCIGIALAVLVGAVSLAGICLDDGGRTENFPTARGTTVELYGGNGLYRFDSFDKAVAMRGFDWTSLCCGLGLLSLTLFLRARGSRTAGYFLAGLFLHFAYAYLLAVMGNSFNALFLPWTALYSVSLAGLFFTLRQLLGGQVPANLAIRYPRRSLAAVLLAFGMLFPVAYLPDILGAYASGQAPAALGSYTTLELPSLELAVMAPLFSIAAVNLLRRRPAGVVIATMLTVASVPMFLSLHLGAVIASLVYGRPLSFQFLAITLVFGGFTVTMFGRSAEPARQGRRHYGVRPRGNGL